MCIKIESLPDAPSFWIRHCAIKNEHPQHIFVEKKTIGILGLWTFTDIFSWKNITIF